MSRVWLTVLLLGLAARPANAQERAESGAAESARLALVTAKNAFEYRDFAKVIEVLEPWVHPPRIVDPKDLTLARELLGIALHVKGEIGRARDEFAEVLRADPDRRLDPFVVPPAVIETFLAVRTSMRAALAQILAERKQPAPAPQLPSVLPYPIFAYAPFGIAHFFALDSPEWGSVWLGLQVLGLGTCVGGYWARRSLGDSNGFLRDPRDQGLKNTFGTVRVAGLLLFGAAWIASAIQGQFLLDAKNAELRSRSGPPPIAGGERAGFPENSSAPVGLGLTFE